MDDIATHPRSLNRGLSRLHRVFVFFYGVIAIMCACIITVVFLEDIHSERVFEAYGWLAYAVVLAVAHWYGARGASTGRTYGRVITRVLACLWLFGFPVGTIIAIYAFRKTGNASWNSEADLANASPADTATPAT
jgi:hypothetical protein